jgi:hypothetical protein
MSHNNRAAKDQQRERNTRAAASCPVCGAAIGQPCRQGVAPHDPRRGAEDLRPTLPRVHAERRAAWVAARARVI